MEVVLLDIPTAPEGGEPFAFGGSQVVTAGFVQALLESDEAESVRVFASPGRRAARERQLAGYRHANRATLIDADELRALPDGAELVLQGLDPSLIEGLHLRWLCGSRRWPVLGMTHDLSDLSVFREVLLTALGRPQPFDAVVCSTACAQSVMSGLFASTPPELYPHLTARLPVIPLGVDARQFVVSPDPTRRERCQLPSASAVVLYLGRLSSRMKADLRPMLQAFSLVPPDVRGVLVIAGGVSCSADEEDVRQLRTRVEELGLMESVSIRANVTLRERADLLATADILVSPPDCLQESFGVVLLEAMATGLPVIAADWNGYREVLDPTCGILIPTRMPEILADVSRRAPLEEKAWWYSEVSQSVSVSVPALAAAITNLLADPDSRRRMGAAGRARVRSTFDWPVVIARYTALWRELLRAAADGPAPAASPFWYNHTLVFAGHPTRRLDADMVLRRSPQADPRSSLIMQPPAFLSRDLLDTILARLECPTRLGALPGEAETVSRHVAYLIKHGLAEEWGDADA